MTDQPNRPQQQPLPDLPLIREELLAEIEQRHRRERLATVPATEIALRQLGRPLPNAALLGGFAALTGLIALDAVAHAIACKFSGKLADANAAAAAEAYRFVRREMEDLAHDPAD